ncbi:MAG: Uma2 family endonuclease [Alphaproteobacteria bacterium]|nr:Uma2 family endonuclease [Alphaproteobacteria bacterium]
MDNLARKQLTYADYLALEDETGFKHEFLDGFAVAMAGGTVAHAALCTRVVVGLAGLERPPCRVYGSELRVRIEATGLTTYPDASVVCDPTPHPEDPQSRCRPRVVVEVLSPSTREHDLSTKFEHYRRIPTLTHILWLEQDRVGGQLAVRQDDGSWNVRDLGPGAVIPLGELGQLGLDGLYEAVDLTPPEA